jgi:hypothetical protein
MIQHMKTVQQATFLQQTADNRSKPLHTAGYTTFRLKIWKK